MVSLPNADQGLGPSANGEAKVVWQRVLMENFAVAEHAWKNHHTVKERRRRPEWWTRPGTLESCSSRKLSIQWLLLKNTQTGTQGLSSVDAGWLPFEETGRQDHTNLQVPVTPADEPCINPGDTGGHWMQTWWTYVCWLPSVFNLKKTRASKFRQDFHGIGLYSGKDITLTWLANNKSTKATVHAVAYEQGRLGRLWQPDFLKRDLVLIIYHAQKAIIQLDTILFKGAHTGVQALIVISYMHV